jgi:hypothetical protein
MTVVTVANATNAASFLANVAKTALANGDPAALLESRKRNPV